MILKPLRYKNITNWNNIYQNNPELIIQLKDGTWMNYTIKTELKTKREGNLKIKWNYYGLTKTKMYILQENKTTKMMYIYQFKTEIFREFMNKILRKHIKSWDSRMAFDGTKETIQLYNNVIEQGELIRMKPI